MSSLTFPRQIRILDLLHPRAMAASSPTQPPGPDLTYGDLVNSIIAHPLFPLIIKKVFDVCQSNAFERSHLIPNFVEAARNATGLQNFAQQHGITEACTRWTSTDMFMSVLVASLNQVSSTGAGDNVTLRHTIAAGQTALSAVWAHPRYVGAVDARGAPEKVQRQDQSSREEVAPRPSDPREVVDSAQRIHEQSLRQAQTPRASTRIALSDKAKETLERWFQDHISVPYPSKQQKDELAALCGISLSSVNNWFGNKRMRVKRKMLQVESQQREEQSISDKVLAPKSKWNAVVLSKIGSQAGRDALESATGASIPVPSALNRAQDERSVPRRAGAEPSVQKATATDTQKVGESSEMIQPRRSRRRQGRPELSKMTSSQPSAPDPQPERANINLSREGHLITSKLVVEHPILPHTSAITGQVREVVSSPGHVLQSQTQVGNSALPGTVALAGRTRYGASVSKEGHSLPPLDPKGPSVLPSILVTTEPVRNSDSVYRGGHQLSPYSLGGIQMPQTTVLAGENQGNSGARTETLTMLKRRPEGPLKLQPAAKLPDSSFADLNPRKKQMQQERESIRQNTQFTTARGPTDRGTVAQDKIEEVSSQTIGHTEQIQREHRGEQDGPSRSTRRTKRRKKA